MCSVKIGKEGFIASDVLMFGAISFMLLNKKPRFLKRFRSDINRSLRQLKYRVRSDPKTS